MVLGRGEAGDLYLTNSYGIRKNEAGLLSATGKCTFVSRLCAP